MSSPFSQATVEAHPDRFIGPQAMGMFLQALEMGFLISQVFRFLVRAEKETWSIRVLVATTVALALSVFCSLVLFPMLGPFLNQHDFILSHDSYSNSTPL